MVKIRYTKNELKQQRDGLKRYTRYLPTLELKKKQLLQEIQRIQREIDQLRSESDRVEREVSQWAAVFADIFDLGAYIHIEEVDTDIGNIAGIDIPIFNKVVFKEIEYDLFDTPLWIDQGLQVAKAQIQRRIEREIAEEQQRILQEELRTTIQRIKLFEEVKIPEARENIRVIQIFLGDVQTAEVVRGKIAKAKIERKKQRASIA